MSTRKRNKPVIGLVGGIGSGKSTVAQLFKARGAAVVDSDRLAHEELCEPNVVRVLREWWGDGVCDANGVPDREKIGAIVFRSPIELSRLEGVLYPRIFRRHDAMIGEFNADANVTAIVLDTPKLLEAGLDDICDSLIFIDSERSERVRRVAATRGWTDAILEEREKLQKPLDMKRASADHVVVNQADVESLGPQIDRVLSSILETFAHEQSK